MEVSSWLPNGSRHRPRPPGLSSIAAASQLRRDDLFECLGIPLGQKLFYSFCTSDAEHILNVPNKYLLNIYEAE